MQRTYYNQSDPRWGSKLYTVTGDKTQTIAKSGCGVTSAAMIISSFISPISPDAMADISVKNGFRTPNEGTSWGLFTYIAERWGIAAKQTDDINTVVACLAAGGMAIASCKGGVKGLFSDSGHIIVLSAVRDGKIVVFDPGLYAGKYNTAPRKNKAVVQGNEVIVSIADTAADVVTYFCYYAKSILPDNQPSVHDVTNELLWRGIISNQALWDIKGSVDEDIKWLFVKYYGYIRKNGGSVKNPISVKTSDDALAILQKCGCLSDFGLWNGKAANDQDVYWLMIKMADYVN